MLGFTMDFAIIPVEGCSGVRLHGRKIVRAQPGFELKNVKFNSYLIEVRYHTPGPVTNKNAFGTQVIYPKRQSYDYHL